MHSSVSQSGVGAAATQYAGTRKRCISSLQVTYHQEIHRQPPQLAVHPPPSLGGPYSGSTPREYGLGEGVHSIKEGRVVPDEEEQDFYGLPAALATTGPPLALPTASWEPSLKPHPPCLSPPPPPQPQLLSDNPAATPLLQSPLFHFEDGLRHKVNLEIENFRASLQEVMREQFTACRYHQSQQSLKGAAQDYPTEVVDQLEAAGQSIETDSGVYGDGSTAAVAEDTPSSPSQNVEEETNLVLIRLQTLTSVITTNLHSAH